MRRLSEFYRIRGRYMRSVNLDRDGEDPSSLRGYLPTRRALDLTRQVLLSYSGEDPNRAWTLTGVYGTGKSACANFLAGLFSSHTSDMRREAFRALGTDGGPKEVAKLARRALPDDGLVRVLAVGRREPVAHTIVRALALGVERFWEHRPGRKPAIVQRVRDLRARLEANASIGEEDISALVADVASASGTGVLIVVDELGKHLEHAARTRGGSDLYLLQQLAELSGARDHRPVLVLGLLHQAFSEYGQLLSTSEKAEWGKIGGRFQDVPFVESSSEMLRLVGEAIECAAPEPIQKAVGRTAEAWARHFSASAKDGMIADLMTKAQVQAVFPLHPVAAIVLPSLCARVGQNDRSLFTFLASSGPHALTGFMEQHSADPDNLSSLRLPQVYDYFLELGSAGLVGHGRSHRWSEIHDHIRDADGLHPDETEALKVIGVLNLVATAGPLRATEHLVLSSLMNRPDDPEEEQRWRSVLEKLRSRNVVTYRTAVDEYRLWQGSDFDIDAAVSAQIESERRSLAEILSSLSPLPPVVAQRHSYRTGSLRYCERRYNSAEDGPGVERLKLAGGAGTVVYWLSDTDAEIVPETTGDGFPLLVVQVPPTPALEASARELDALIHLDGKETALQSDKVARREVRARLGVGQQVLEAALDEALGSATRRWLAGEPDTQRDRLNSAVSRLCDRAYPRGPAFWNEIINRRELTSQGARAQRELIDALLSAHDQEDLGITGHGPEFSIYDSLLRSTGIHRREGDNWVIGAPTSSAVAEAWGAIEDFCLGSTGRPRSVAELYDVLEAPPFGVKRGVIPVLLAAVLINHAEDVSVYQDGSFLPVLGSPHFELLVKDPARFAVKHFELAGVRWEVFRELEALLRAGGAKKPARARNATLLTVVRPLVRFANDLPPITRTTCNLSKEVLAVREALLNTREPDQLIFESLPTALGLERLEASSHPDDRVRDTFKTRLFAALRELQQHYEGVLDRCRAQLQTAFRVDSAELREDLRVRASYLSGKVIDPTLRSFVKAASDSVAGDRAWLEALVMVIADRPAKSWTDEDFSAFEMRLADLARRFLSLYALRAEGLSQDREGFEASRITITTPEGGFLEDLVWVNLKEQELVRQQASDLLDTVRKRAGSEHQHLAILVTMLQKAMDPTDREQAGGVPVDPDTAQEKRHA